MKTLPQPAPSTDSLERIRDRLIAWSLRNPAVELPDDVAAAADSVAALYDQRIAGSDPAATEFSGAWRRLAYLADRAERAYRDYRAEALVTMLGDRLTPIAHLDRSILDDIEAGRYGLDMDSYHDDNADHPCGTTHCRAGSAIIKHPIGPDLERVFGPFIAGAVIYLKSTGRIPDFFASNDDALADMRKCAEMMQ